MRVITALRKGGLFRSILYQLIPAVVWIVSANVSAVELHESLDRAAVTVGADYWAIASGPQWTPDAIKDLGVLVKQEPRQWLARAWYARMHLPAAAALSQRVDALLQECGAPPKQPLGIDVVGLHTWSSDKADLAMRAALSAETMTLPDHFAVVLEALIHPRRPVSSIARFHLTHECLVNVPVGGRGVLWVQETGGTWNGTRPVPGELKLLEDIRASCLAEAPPEVGIPLASVEPDEIGRRYLESLANESGPIAAIAGLYRGAQLIPGQRVFIAGTWLDTWLSQIDQPTIDALAAVLCPAPAPRAFIKSQHRFFLSTYRSGMVDPMAMGPVLRLHADKVAPEFVRRFTNEIDAESAYIVDMLPEPDLFDEDDGRPASLIVGHLEALLAAPLPLIADRIQGLVLKDQHGIRFRDELVTRLRTGRKARYPSGVELQHFQEFLFPVKVIREEP